MRLEQLEKQLRLLEGFQKPAIQYEQYATDAHLAGTYTFIPKQVFNMPNIPNTCLICLYFS